MPFATYELLRLSEAKTVTISMAMFCALLALCGIKFCTGVNMRLDARTRAAAAADNGAILVGVIAHLVFIEAVVCRMNADYYVVERCIV